MSFKVKGNPNGFPVNEQRDDWEVTTRPWPPPISYDGRITYMRTDPQLEKTLARVEQKADACERHLQACVCAQFVIGFIIFFAILKRK